MKELSRLVKRSPNGDLQMLMLLLDRHVHTVSLDTIPDVGDPIARIARSSDARAEADVRELIDRVARNASSQTRDATKALNEVVPEVRALAKAEFGPKRKLR